jgi:flagellar biosynthesis/type III secretory pathway protein FliH
MSITETTNGARHLQETMAGAAEARMRDAKAVLRLVPTPANGLLNPSDVINQYGRLTKRVLEVNLEYVRDLAGAVRKHVTGLAGVLKDEVVTSAKLANDQAEKLEEAAIEQADEIERAERAAARRAKKAAHDAAAERYQDMTKAELADELAKRQMPKTGNVDELRERLVDDDLKTTA